MKIASSLACLLLFPFSLDAQITAVLRKFPARSPEIEIRNGSTVDLTAFAVSMAPAAGGGESAPLLVYVDAAVATDRLAAPGRLIPAMPLPPGEEYGVPMPGRLQAGRPVDLFEPPIVTAAIFTDGSTSGDASLLAKLLVRRSNMLQAVELAVEILSTAGRHNVPRAQLIAQFQTLAESVAHWYLPAEQRVGRSLYQSIAGKLMNLPEGQLGAPFPPTSFVEQEISLLNRDRTALLQARPNLADTIGVR